jgi:hypothetical protein
MAATVERVLKQSLDALPKRRPLRRLGQFVNANRIVSGVLVVVISAAILALAKWAFG